MTVRYFRLIRPDDGGVTLWRIYRPTGASHSYYAYDFGGPREDGDPGSTEGWEESGNAHIEIAVSEGDYNGEEVDFPTAMEELAKLGFEPDPVDVIAQGEAVKP